MQLICQGAFGNLECSRLGFAHLVYEETVELLVHHPTPAVMCFNNATQRSL